MPQSSILAWINNTSTASQKPENQATSNSQHEKNELQTPPRSGDDVREQMSPPPAENNINISATEPNGKRALPPNVTFRACGKDDIPQLKRLNSLLLPIPYPESFYREICEDAVTNNVTLLAFWRDSPTADGSANGRLVGAVRCRVLNDPPGVGVNQNGPMLYLSTLVLLSPYRSHGIATHMLNTITKRAINDYGITSLGAHVWEANSDALVWYRNRGFTELRREEAYYRKLNPQAAVVMQRRVSVMDLVSG